MTTEGGLLLVDKTSESSSHDVVLAARRGLSVKRIGHTGTLDPFATGLLLLLVGSLTRCAELFHALPKTYVATMRLGRETDTDDLTGETIRESDQWKTLDADGIASALAARIGSSLQVPSTFSAKRIRGQRAYRLARDGESVDLPANPVVIHDLRLDRVEADEVRFHTRVSTGTYIRALARDLGRDLGCGAHLVELRRTEVGPFTVSDAIVSDEISHEVRGFEAAFRQGAAVVPWLPRRGLDPEERAAVLQGRVIASAELSEAEWSDWGTGGPEKDLVALTDETTLVAIAERDGERLHPRKVFVA